MERGSEKRMSDRLEETGDAGLYIFDEEAAFGFEEVGDA